MEKLIVNFFKEHNLILHKKRLVVAVSTGVDSMALLVSLLNLRDEYNLDIHIVHVNHMVREQSNLEEEYILSFGKKNKLSVHAMHLEHNENINFQSYARTKRYGFFFNVMKEVKADYLLLAHHGIDNMETIIMRILRGSSLKGYAGIMPVQEVEGFKILRPFLNILKDELIDYINLHKIKYYEDYTNNEEIYTRNRIRKDLIPVMFQEEKNAHLKFNEFSNVLLEASNVIEEKVNGIIGTFIRGEKSISFTINEFKKYSDYIKEEILFTILKDYELSKANILEIIKLIDSKKKNIKVEFKDSFTFVKEYDKIIILYYLTKPLVVDLEIDGTKSKIINDTIEINVTKTDGNYIPSNDKLWYNSNMLPVRIRSRKPGDKILLENGYKKVKDLLIDLKVGILKRENILIMEKDEEILAVIGIRKSVNLKKQENNDILINVRFNIHG